MRILVSASILVLATAAALPSSACDRHGGMFGQLGGASWTDYNPETAESDALFLEKQLNEWHKKVSAPPAEVKPAKPSFSNASNRASMAAQARMAKKAKLTQTAKAQTPSSAKSQNSAEMAPR